MNKIYDNGSNLLGRVKDIIEYTDLDSIDDETTIQLIEDLKEYDLEDIVFIDYDRPMGYRIDRFSKEDIIWECE